MTDIRLEREFAVSPERLYRAITERADLTQWWGPETMRLAESRLDFSAPGAWFAMLTNDEGQRFRMSGHVTHADPPRSVGLTWGWDDENGGRGPESFVTFTVTATASGARLIIDHRDLPDGDAASGHERGWTSSLASLAAYLT